MYHRVLNHTECFQIGCLYSFYFQSNQWRWQHFRDLAVHLREAFTTLPASNKNYSGHLPCVLGWAYFTTAFRKVFFSCSFIIWLKRLKTEAGIKASYRWLEEIRGGRVRRNFLAVIPLLASKALATFCIPPNPPDSDASATGAICGSFSNQQMEQLAGWGWLSPHCPEILLTATSSHHTDWIHFAYSNRSWLLRWSQ